MTAKISLVLLAIVIAMIYIKACSMYGQRETFDAIDGLVNCVIPLMLVLFASVFVGDMLHRRIRRRILLNGVPAHAIILKVHSSISDNIKLDLEVQPAGHAPYQTETSFRFRTGLFEDTGLKSCMTIRFSSTQKIPNMSKC